MSTPEKMGRIELQVPLHEYQLHLGGAQGNGQVHGAAGGGSASSGFFQLLSGASP